MYRIPAYRVSLVRDGSVRQEDRPRVANSASVAELFRSYIGDADREHFVVAALDSKNVVIGLNTVSVGSLNSNVVHPREVLKYAILASAAAIVCGHNHPSGDPTPSREDRECTSRLVSACQVVGIRMLDHVVIGDAGQVFSFADAGLIAE